MQKRIKEDKNYLKVYFNIFQIEDLSLFDSMVLSLLISYDLNNDKDITLTSKSISKHFNGKIAKKTIDSIISKLEKLGYITKSLLKHWYEDSGKYHNKRFIYITQKTYDIINGELPIKDTIQSAEPTTSSKPSEAPKLVKPNTEPKAIETHVDVVKTVEPKTELEAIENAEEKVDIKAPDYEKSIYPIPKIVITDEKLKWLQNEHKNPDITKKDLESFKEEDRAFIFYGDNGVWGIDKQNMENKYLIKIRSVGGSFCTVLNLNQKGERIEVNLEDLMYLLEQRGLTIGDLNPDIYRNICVNGLPKKPKDNDINMKIA